MGRVGKVVQEFFSVQQVTNSNSPPVKQVSCKLYLIDIILFTMHHCTLYLTLHPTFHGSNTIAQVLVFSGG